jgi:predicted Zn-dependent protease
MDREEQKLARSPLLIKNDQAERYVKEVACKVGGAHCRDMRVYIVRNARFNATMAPNGTMQVWSGLLLRTENEAQLAAVLGHEMGHFVARDTLTRLRSMRQVGDVAAFLGLGVALAGVPAGAEAVSTIAILSLLSYSREQETAADQFGLAAMYGSGYAGAEAARLWSGLAAEDEARPDGRRSVVPFLASHPPSRDREDALRRAAAERGAEGHVGQQTHRAALSSIMPMLLADEVRLRQPERSLALFSRLLTAQPGDPLLLTASGEVHRLRNAGGDEDRALAAFEQATARPGAPATAWRGIGLIERRRGNGPAAEAAFRRYLAAVPEPSDAAMIRSYLGVPR